MTHQTDNDIIPIFRPAICSEEIDSVQSVLHSGWLGSGPITREFESAFAKSCGAPFAVSTINGTAALTATLSVLGVGPGDEIVLPSFTYVSVFQVIRGLGAIPVFADIEPEFLTLDPADVARRMTPRTKGIITVHHGGQLSDMESLSNLAEETGVWLIDDAAHAVGAFYHGKPVGSLALATCFSFSAVKNLTTGDGGMVTLHDEDLARALTTFRNLGIEEDTWDRYGTGTEVKSERWAYRMHGYGQRLHMNDIASAIGFSQLRRLPELNRLRSELVGRYEKAFADVSAFRSIKPRQDTIPSWHMYTVLMDERDKFVDAMRALGITVGVHYYPVHLYPTAKFHRSKLNVTEEIWKKVTTFPLYPTMKESEQERVIDAARHLAVKTTRHGH